MSKRKRSQCHSMLHTTADLNQKRTNVVAGLDPWTTAYNDMAATSQGSATYVMKGPKTFFTRDHSGDQTNLAAITSDGRAAINLALRYYISGSETYRSAMLTRSRSATHQYRDSIGGSESREMGNGHVGFRSIRRWFVHVKAPSARFDVSRNDCWSSCIVFVPNSQRNQSSLTIILFGLFLFICCLYFLKSIC